MKNEVFYSVRTIEVRISISSWGSAWSLGPPLYGVLVIIAEYIYRPYGTDVEIQAESPGPVSRQAVTGTVFGPKRIAGSFRCVVRAQYGPLISHKAEMHCVPKKHVTTF